MSANLPLFAAIAFGAALGGFVQGLSGFAFSLVAMSVWAWTLPPQVAAPIAVGCALLGQFASFANFRRGFDLSVIAPFVVGGAVGVPIGVFLLHNADPRGFKLAVGGALLVYSLFGLLSRRMPRVQAGGKSADALVGIVGGIFGGLGGMAGTAPAAWSLLRGWKAELRRATMQVYNIAMHVITLTIYWRTGALDATPALLYAVAIPAMLIPAFVGAHVHSRTSEAAMTRVILMLLLASGAALVLGASGVGFGRR